MALVIMNLLILLFSVAFVRCDQTNMPLKSFKIGKNATYHCIDIYKQPGLDHPLLKNHTIQMKPSRTELNSQTDNNNNTRQGKIKCPNGTIPVLRNTKELVTNANLFAEKYVHPQSADSRIHIAGVRSQAGPYHGVQAWIYGVNLKVEKDQAAFSQVYVGSSVKNKVNYISAGFMINPGFIGDGRVWSYGYWQGKDGKGCFNTACSERSQRQTIHPLHDEKKTILYTKRWDTPSANHIAMHILALLAFNIRKYYRSRETKFCLRTCAEICLYSETFKN